MLQWLAVVEVIFKASFEQGNTVGASFHQLELSFIQAMLGLSLPRNGLNMPRTSEIRALHRGLEILELANLHNNARLRDFVDLTGLPKTTVYRLLDNLCAAGYLTRVGRGDRYRLTVQVRRLSDGYQDSGWISDVARPLLRKLCDEISYPVAIATPYGTAMMLRDNTDSESALVTDVYTRGTLLPLFTSATGKVYLAFCDHVTRKTILDVCADSPDPDHDIARHPRLVEQIITQVQKQGYAFGQGGRFNDTGIKTSTCAVPIRAANRLIGCLAVRYVDKHLSRDEVAMNFVTKLKRCANLIGRRVAGIAATTRPV